MKNAQMSPNRVKERLNSARKYSQNVNFGDDGAAMGGPSQQVQGASPNKSHRNLVRANSQYGRNENQNNILGQPMPQQTTNKPESYHRTGSASRMMAPAAGSAAALIQGGYENVNYKDSQLKE